MGHKADTGEWYEWMGRGGGIPVDIPLLNKFCNIFIERWYMYKELLETIALYASERCDPDERRSRERNIDKLVARMSAPLEPLQAIEVSAVRWFLIEVRAEWNGEPVRCRDYVKPNAHILATVAMRQAADEWRRLRRLHRNTPIPAWERFYELVTPELPSTQELAALLQLEYAIARKVLLKEQCESSQQTTNT